MFVQTGEENFWWADNVILMFRFANPAAMTRLDPNPLPLLSMIRDYDASDPRDKLFASMSLIFNSGVGRSLRKVMVPDYTKRTETVFRDLMRYLIRKLEDRNLAGLCMVQPHRASVQVPQEFSHAYNPDEFLSAPASFASWIPRWEYGFGLGNSGPLGLFPDPPEGARPLYQASGTLPSQAVTLRSPTEPNSLVVRGVKLDRVTSVIEAIWGIYGDLDCPPHPLMGSIACSDRNALWLGLGSVEIPVVLQRFPDMGTNARAHQYLSRN